MTDHQELAVVVPAGDDPGRALRLEKIRSGGNFRLFLDSATLPMTEEYHG